MYDVLRWNHFQLSHEVEILFQHCDNASFSPEMILMDPFDKVTSDKKRYPLMCTITQQGWLNIALWLCFCFCFFVLFNRVRSRIIQLTVADAWVASSHSPPLPPKRALYKKKQ